jgi:hypothetical protein
MDQGPSGSPQRIIVAPLLLSQVLKTSSDCPLSSFLCSVADHFRCQPWVLDVVDVFVDEVDEVRFWMEGGEMVVSYVFVIGEVGV